jgi:transcription termination/antitermination protein NusA
MSTSAPFPDESVVALFIRATGATSDEATALVNHGFRSVEEIAYVPHWELESVSEISAESLASLRQRAREFVLDDASNE